MLPDLYFKMNNRGQTMGLAILSFLGVLIVGLMFVNFLMPEVTTFRTDMSCASPDNISDGVKLVCLVGDTVVIYWIWAILSLSLGGIISRLI